MSNSCPALKGKENTGKAVYRSVGPPEDGRRNTGNPVDRLVPPGDGRRNKGNPVHRSAPPGTGERFKGKGTNGLMEQRKAVHRPVPPGTGDRLKGSRVSKGLNGPPEDGKSDY